MPDFDSELYLRLLGERWLAGQLDDQRMHSPLVEAARALVAVGAAEVEQVKPLVDTYHEAIGLRRPDTPFAHHHIRGRAAAAARSKVSPQPARVCSVGAVLETKTGELTVHWISLGADRTRLGVSFEFARRRHRRGPGGVGGPPSFRLLAEGMRQPVGADFSGGGSGDIWTGHLESQVALPRDTTWIEIDGILLDIEDGGPELTVASESLAPRDPAIAYLWHVLAEPGHRHHRDDALVVPFETLRAAGMLPADDSDPDVAALLWVAGARLAGRLPAAAIPSGGKPPERVPAQWRSLSHGGMGRSLGPIALGVVTPEIDGFEVTFDALDLGPDETQLTVGVSPGIGIGHFDFDLRAGLAWWIVDDCGNHYLGEMRQWGGGDDRSEGVLAFPVIDRRATSLTLVPTGLHSRALITVPLA
jgi:hypothetical protein